MDKDMKDACEVCCWVSLHMFDGYCAKTGNEPQNVLQASLGTTFCVHF